MSLVKVKDLLAHAQEHGYGVPAINVFDYNSIKFAAMAAEEAKMPLIIQYFPGFDVHAPLIDIRNIAVAFARRATVPIAVHLDHSKNFEIAVSGLGDPEMQGKRHPLVIHLCHKHPDRAHHYRRV